jgi:hypothetical protein
MGDHGKAPAQGETPQKSSCVQTALCQAGAVAPPLTAGILAELYFPRSTGKHDIVSDRAAPSRPPDRDLRPPIFI